MEGYGLTECSPVVAVNTFDWREPGFFQPGSRRGYVGQPLPGVLVRIVSNETFEPLGPDEQGLVLVKGPNVMRGYLGRDDLTQAAFRDGWYITGDQGFLSEDGFLKITGRLSRFSKIGGEMVPHGLIEESLNEAVAGNGTQLFAVTAVGDERKGEKLVVLHTVDEAQVKQAFDALGRARTFPTCSSPGATSSSRSTRSRSWAPASSTCEPCASWPKPPRPTRSPPPPPSSKLSRTNHSRRSPAVAPEVRRLLEHNPPLAGDTGANHDTAVVFLVQRALEVDFTLEAAANDCGVCSNRPHADLGIRAVVNRITRRLDNRHDRMTVHRSPVWSDVNIVIGHQPLDRGVVLFKPGAIPGFIQDQQLVDH